MRWSVERTSALILVQAAFIAVAACGGGGGGGGNPPPPPPATLSYAEPSPVYESEVAITPNVPTTTGGVPDHYAVVPALPTGLLFNPLNGVVSGTPTTPVAADDYVVTASNGSGSAQATLSITVFLNRALDLSPKATFTDDDVRYFLGRTQFGGSKALFDAVK